MSKVAVFVSDLHLGRGDDLEDFVPENERAFVKFLAEQSAGLQGSEVDLVILGDFLDIWQVATDNEKMAEKSTAINLDVTVDRETKRVKKIISAHKDTFDALRLFLEADSSKRRILCIPGNHDHSLVDHDVRQPVYDAIVKGQPALDQRVVFPCWYDEPALLCYGEHGNQFDENNDYGNFREFGPESPGFFFVRLFWNRLEPLEPNCDVWLESFIAIWQNSLWHLIVPAARLYSQYLGDPRDFERIDIPGVPFRAAPGAPSGMPVTGKSLPEFPELLFSSRRDPQRFFSMDDATENRLRKLYHDPAAEGFKMEVDKILNKKYGGKTQRVPKDPVAGVRAWPFSDPYVDAVEGMFAPAGQTPETWPMKGSALNEDRCRYVLFGHTHEEKQEPVGTAGVTYFNTGSWSVRLDADGCNVSRPCFVTVRKKPDGTVEAKQEIWPL